MGERSLRLVNFLVDTTIYLFFSISVIYLFNSVIQKEMVKWFSLIIYVLYYIFFEFVTDQTIGKMITKSKVYQKNDNRSIYLLQIVVRSIARIIPLDVISYLFFRRGLHDWISGTYVSRIKQS